MRRAMLRRVMFPCTPSPRRTQGAPVNRLTMSGIDRDQAGARALHFVAPNCPTRSTNPASSSRSRAPQIWTLVPPTRMRTRRYFFKALKSDPPGPRPSGSARSASLGFKHERRRGCGRWAGRPGAVREEGVQVHVKAEVAAESLHHHEHARVQRRPSSKRSSTNHALREAGSDYFTPHVTSDRYSYRKRHLFSRLQRRFRKRAGHHRTR
jgi:hypothetical protein